MQLLLSLSLMKTNTMTDVLLWYHTFSTYKLIEILHVQKAIAVDSLY